MLGCVPVMSVNALHAQGLLHTLMVKIPMSCSCHAFKCSERTRNVSPVNCKNYYVVFFSFQSVNARHTQGLFAYVNCKNPYVHTLTKAAIHFRPWSCDYLMHDQLLWKKTVIIIRK